VLRLGPDGRPDLGLVTLIPRTRLGIWQEHVCRVVLRHAEAGWSVGSGLFGARDEWSRRLSLRLPILAWDRQRTSYLEIYQSHPIAIIG
jgi:hypothetical protein